MQELKRPMVLLGYAVLGLAIALWLNYFISRQPTQITTSKTGDQITLYDSMGQVKNVPRGLFSYGGALYFAPLVAYGMNDSMQQSHPYFELKYTKPQNQDQSYSKGIQMLLNGELSFAFNGRPLTAQEYTQAKLQGVSLQQIPIAMDGIIFFGHDNTSIDDLSLDQVKGIFRGEITNWQQLGGGDLPITPVMLTPENIEILGLSNVSQIPQATQYVSNYSQALRQVISTPGSISFASASLVRKQKLIKIFNLAAENSTNYINPLAAGKTNLKQFKNGTYPLTRRLFVVIRQDGTPEQLAGKAYAEMLLSNEGQGIVRLAGLSPLYGDQLTRK